MTVGEQWLVRMPGGGETCVFPQSSATWRRDALMFDRVYAPMKEDQFSDIWNQQRPLIAPDIPIEFSFADEAVDLQNARDQGNYSRWFEGATSSELDSLSEDFHRIDYDYRIRADRELEESYRNRGIMGTWCASERGLFIKRFSEGETVAYQGALNNLPIVSADITWEEVRSFREDRESVRKYRDLRLWLGESLKASSERHATDLIAQRIEDYRWAVSKHGLQTATGALANLWDWKQSVALAAGAGAASTLSGAAVAALIAGLAITSGIGAYFVERKITEKDVSRGTGREVAILVDIQDRFGAA